MSTDITLPALGESVTEGTVTRWLKKVGDPIAVDEPLLEVSTDKVDTEIPSPVAGTLLEIVVDEDATVEVGAVLARVGDSSEGASSSGAPESAAAPEPPAPAASGAPSSEQAAPPAPEPAPAPVSSAAPAPTPAASADPVGSTQQEQQTPAPQEAAPQASDAGASSPGPSAGEGQDVTLPALGESVTEGTVTRWLKNVGDDVSADEPLVEISTDKVDTEIPSPLAGKLLEILVGEDETVKVGSVLARIGSSDAAPSAAPAPAPVPEAKPAAPMGEPAATPAAEAAAPAQQERQPEPPAAAAPAATGAAPASAGSTSGYVTPIVRKLAADRGVDLASVQGSGVGGRIRKEDVLAAKPAAQQAAPAPAQGSNGDRQSAKPAVGSVSSLRGTTVKMSRIRSITAEKMMESLHGMAQLTTVVEVDCTKIWNLRAQAKDAFEQREGAKLTFLPFFTFAAAEALKEHAFLNASVDGDSIVYHPSVNLSLAVDTEKGLMLPTLRDADSKSLADHARGIADLAQRARDGGLKSDEISGGTFSVTNTGSGGTLLDTPIVPAPQVGIMATCAITKKAVVVKGADGADVLAIRPTCYLPLSYDHRIVDGADAARFLQTVKARIEGGAFEDELGL